ncbi:MAG: hypothetical protein WC101_00450 [Candidatus Gracilibacteria bacterium]
MRLKVPPKEAILKIDALLKEGADIFDFIAKDYWEQEDKEEKREKDEEEKREQELQKITEERGAIFASMAARDMPQPILSIFGSRVSPDIIKSYEVQHAKWIERVKEALGNIYEDFAPLYQFLYAKIEYQKNTNSGAIYNDFVRVKETLREQTNVLAGFYKDLRGDIRSPLFYIPEKNKVCFYDLVCQLQPDSNEAQLCKFLFQFSFGEFKEMEDAYVFMTGTDIGDEKNWKTKITSAYDGINEKTNKQFGFPIIQKEKSTITLVFPSRFLS